MCGRSSRGHVFLQATWLHWWQFRMLLSGAVRLGGRDAWLSGGVPQDAADTQLLRQLCLLFEGRLCVCVLQTKNFDILFHVTYCKKKEK